MQVTPQILRVPRGPDCAQIVTSSLKRSELLKLMEMLTFEHPVSAGR